MLGRLLAAIKNPAQLLVGAFVTLILLGAGLLSLPIASDSGSSVSFNHALFMSTSSTTVTGLGTLDVREWSLFGELVILGLIQIGGFGIMTIGSVLVLLTAKRVGLRHRMLAQAEIGAVELGDLRRLIKGVAVTTAVIEAAIACILFARFWQSGAESAGSAAYNGVFHSIAAFNNAGISLYHDNLMRYEDDFVIVMAVSVALILGGIGFPIILELARRVRPKQWRLHTKITLTATVALLVIGPLLVLAFEWTNPGTLGHLSVGDKTLAAWFQGVTPRTAGFNTIDNGALNESTLLVTTALMFIGAGPASTAGGIKVTTFALLGYVLWSEVRGNADVDVFKRTVPPVVIRQAIAVVLVSIGAVVVTTLFLLSVTDLTLTPVLFEASSAFGTVGLSTGITGTLPTIGQLALALLMLAGRVGPMTFVTALTLRHSARLYRYPEERPIIG